MLNQQFVTVKSRWTKHFSFLGFQVENKPTSSIIEYPVIDLEQDTGQKKSSKIKSPRRTASATLYKQVTTFINAYQYCLRWQNKQWSENVKIGYLSLSQKKVKQRIFNFSKNAVLCRRNRYANHNLRSRLRESPTLPMSHQRRPRTAWIRLDNSANPSTTKVRPPNAKRTKRNLTNLRKEVLYSRRNKSQEM